MSTFEHTQSRKKQNRETRKPINTHTNNNNNKPRELQPLTHAKKLKRKREKLIFTCLVCRSPSEIPEEQPSYSTWAVVVYHTSGVLIFRL